LTAWGAVEETERTYRLGIRLFELASAVPTVRQLRAIALPFIEDLYESTHEVVHLGVLDGADVLYLEKISGRRSVALMTAVGGRRSAYCTAIGKSLLAFADKRTLRKILSGKLERLTPQTISSPVLLAEQFADIQRTRIAYEFEECVRGIGCVGSPVLTQTRSAIAALSIATPVGRFNPESLGPAVRTAAFSLGRALSEAGIQSIGPRLA
jgi:DNA-binding IclR family transcriptional regulator